MNKPLLLFSAFILLYSSSIAQTGISAGGTAPDASAMLDVIASDKGFLAPRVALLANNNSTLPIASPAAGLLVYNTATAGSSPNNVTPGYYYWDGTVSLWQKISAGNSLGFIQNQNSADQTANWRITGSGQWGGATSKGSLSTDQGSSIELGGTGSPYIDIANATADDFDVRMQLSGNDELTYSGAGLTIAGSWANALRTQYFSISSDNAGPTDRPYIRGTATHLVINGYAKAGGGTLYLNYPGDLTSGTTDTRIQETMYITATGSGGGGNVGIGPTGATEKLEVSGAIKMPGASATDNNSPALTLVSDDDFLYDAEYINHYAFGFHNFNDGAGSGANSYISGYYGVDLFTGGAQRFRVNNNGTVKINNLAGTGNRFVVADASGNLSATSSISSGVVTGSGTTNYLARWTAINTLGIGVTFDNGTNVGISNTNPLAKLHISDGYPLVAGNDGMLKIKSIAITGSGSCCGTEGISLQTSIDNRADDYTISGYGGDIRHVLSLQPLGGYVGIGTTGPNQKLEIGSNGGIGFSGTGLNSADKKLYSPADGDLEWVTHNSAGAHGFAVSHQGAKAVYLNTSGNSYFTGGNLGIGTTGPAESVHSTGNIRADGIVYWGNGLSRTETRDNAGLQGNAGAKSGFFETSAPSNYYTGASSWQHLIDVRHSNNGNNYAMQLAGSFFDQRLFFRKTNNSASTAWSEVSTIGRGNGGMISYVKNEYYGVSGTRNSWVTVTGASPWMDVKVGDQIKLDGMYYGRLTGGSNNEFWYSRVQITGQNGCGTNYSNQHDYWHVDEDGGNHDNYKPVVYMDVWDCNCTGQIRFEYQIYMSGDDNWEAREIIITGTRY